MVKYVVLLKRRPEIDHDTFMKEWQGAHLDLIKQLPGLRRCVLNDPISVPNYAPDFDGLGILWFDSVEAAFEAFASPQGQATRQDTPRFADPDSVIRFFAEEVEDVS